MRFIKLLAEKILPRWLLRAIIEKMIEIKGRKNEHRYKGNIVLCPCCGKTFNQFIDFNVNEKDVNPERYKETYKNKICPYCFSAPRHRIVCYYFNKNKELLPKNKIIMFGAEYSIKKWFCKNGFRYITADLFNRSAHKKVDIQNIPFADESWELIICNHVLEHIPDYKLALKELRRILTKNGILELTIPTDRNLETVYEDVKIATKEDRKKYFGQYDHLRIFGNDFDKILSECGFSVEIINGDNLPDEIVGVVGPADTGDNRVYICRKK